MGAAYKTRLSGEANPHWKGETNTCANCGDKYRNYSPYTKYCCRECFLVSGANKCPTDLSGKRFAARADNNHDEIVRALEDAGVSVADFRNVRGGIPDICAAHDGYTALIEVKNPKTHYGKSGLNKLQEAFAKGWPGDVFVVHNAEEALAVFGIGGRKRPTPCFETLRKAA